MAQTVIDGLTGSVTLPGLTQYVASINLTTGADLLDTSHYGGGGWRSRVAGIKDLAGSCVAFMTEGAVNTCPLNLSTAAGSMTIAWSAGCFVTFNAIIGNTQIVGEYAGLNIVTFNFSHDNQDGSDVQITWNTST